MAETTLPLWRRQEIVRDVRRRAFLAVIECPGHTDDDRQRMLDAIDRRPCRQLLRLRHQCRLLVPGKLGKGQGSAASLKLVVEAFANRHGLNGP